MVSVNESASQESSNGAYSIANGQIAIYDEPIVDLRDSFKYYFSNPVQKSKSYAISLFPILQWIYRYNLTWLYGDLIAGITVGCVLVPQSMSYAKIAELPPQYGLYSSFVGVIIYCFFATSKDVSIGPVAVMSLQTSKVVSKVLEKYPEYTGQEHVIATTLALLCGSIALGIGILRIGFILEYVPIPAVLGFMTGSAFTILVGQVPNLFGIQKLLDTRAATHLVVINTLKNLKYAKLDTAFGFVSLFWLYFIRWICEYLTKKYPKYKKPLFFANVLRAAIVIILSTLISWGVCRHHHDGKYPISIIKTVPRGLQNVGVHKVESTIVKTIASELPVSTIVLMLEHIAISKSFGRLNDYKINPNQELIAIGVTNLIGQFFQAYPATGSFSRSALKSKCGVRTPLAGIYTGVCVIVAIYGLTSAFYWISNATLGAIIIHAVGDLIADWRTSFRLWKTSPIEFVIFLGSVFLSVFVSLESGIYFSIACSIFWLLLRVSFPRGEFLGRVKYVEVFYPPPRGTPLPSPNEHSAFENLGNELSYSETRDHVNGLSEGPLEILESQSIDSIQQEKNNVHECTKEKGKESIRSISTTWSLPKYKWVPLSRKSINTDIDVQPPPPGVFVFRPAESFTYPNASRQTEIVADFIRRNTRKKIDQSYTEIKLGDRPWNDHGPRHRVFDADDIDERPILRAIFYDFSATPHTDLTGVQSLVDLKHELDKYAGQPVEYHFVGILSPWIRRALIAAGFGGYNEMNSTKFPFQEVTESASSHHDEEAAVESPYLPIVATNTPYFHLDIPDLSEFE